MPDSILYPALGAVALLAAGVALALKANNKLGWLLVAGGVFWLYHILHPLIGQAH
ncbi:MAG: hypothetical protein K1X53_13085 [Candidatus Sumerlaeaceae bacterium]|nr:hypothetical protein [Candidatus Sumerlaeaceae bacterium]